MGRLGSEFWVLYADWRDHVCRWNYTYRLVGEIQRRHIEDSLGGRSTVRDYVSGRFVILFFYPAGLKYQQATFQRIVLWVKFSADDILKYFFFSYFP